MPFYFPDMLPNQPYDEQREVMRQITPGEGRDRLITPKNLYARLIAETGSAGDSLVYRFRTCHDRLRFVLVVLRSF